MTVTYEHAHYVFRAVGHFGPDGTTKRDFWSSGFRLGSIGSDVPVAPDYTTFLTTASAAIKAFHQDPGVPSGNTCWVDELTIARVGTDGKYLPSTQMTQRRAEVPPYSGVNSPTHTWNTALVMSLRTTVPRGIGSNGRTYWPALRAAVDTGTGRTTSNVGFIAAAQVLIRALNTASAAALGSTVRVIVAGALGKTGPARHAVVTSVRADDRLDTIEKRENDQPASWSTLPI